MTQSDEELLNLRLAKLMEEDPTALLIMTSQEALTLPVKERIAQINACLDKLEKGEYDKLKG